MSCITTVTGKHFDPTEPNDGLIDIFDIAHALSLICRANGHFSRFYSVAQHSLACAREAEAREYSDDLVLACLLHDASEAYLSDVTRPVKALLPRYLESEEKLQNMIWEHFIWRGLTPEEKEKVFEIDDAMLSMEFHTLMPEDIDGRYAELVSDVDFSEKAPADVRDEFIDLIDRYGR
ncbi:MAG: phosphohydrolase [Clostridia bacterium]|nr:phosphohydrolase [Clostridia bacterium]